MDSPHRQVAKSGDTIRDNQPIKHRSEGQAPSYDDHSLY